MKKFIIPVILFFVIVIGSIIFAVSESYDRVQYDKDAMFHSMSLSNDGTLTAEYKGIVTQVLGRNTQRIHSMLTVSAKKRLYFKPTYDENETIYLTFSDGAEYIVVENTSMNDSVYIKYSYKKKSQWFKITGYNSLKWAKQAISPDGIYIENILISGNPSTE